MDPKNLEEGIKLPCSDRRLMTQRTKTEPPAYNQISESDCFLQKRKQKAPPITPPKSSKEANPCLIFWVGKKTFCEKKRNIFPVPHVSVESKWSVAVTV